MRNIIKSIKSMEAQGQRQMMEGTLLPRNLSDCTEASLTELGFELGDVVDDHFRKGRLPSGWTMKPDGGAFHTEIIDERGNHRGYLSYKASPRDRWAQLSVK
jgi:hypothetical protein